MKNLPSYTNLCTRFVLTLLGLGAMFGLPAYFGWEESYSRYYTHSPLLFTLIFNILALGLMIHRNQEWKYPSLFLIVLALFNMHDFPFIHYSSAVLFFFTTTYAMWNDKRVAWFGRISLIGYILFFIDLMWFEMFQVFLMCIFHLLYTFKLFFLKINK